MAGQVLGLVQMEVGRLHLLEEDKAPLKEGMVEAQVGLLEGPKSGALPPCGSGHRHWPPRGVQEDTAFGVLLLLLGHS